jgi:hypothetical protein
MAMALPVYRADRARRDFTQSQDGRIWWPRLGCSARIVAAKALGVFAASLYRLFETTDKGDSDSEPGRAPAWRDQLASSSRTLPGLEDVASIEEVVEIIGKERRWIIRNKAHLPFVMRISRKHYVCSRIALRRWLATRPRALKGR